MTSNNSFPGGMDHEDLDDPFAIFDGVGVPEEGQPAAEQVNAEQREATWHAEANGIEAAEPEAAGPAVEESAEPGAGGHFGDDPQPSPTEQPGQEQTVLAQAGQDSTSAVAAHFAEHQQTQQLPGAQFAAEAFGRQQYTADSQTFAGLNTSLSGGQQYGTPPSVQQAPQAGTARSADSKKPLYFLIGSGVFLMVVLIIVFFTQVFGEGRSIADGSSSAAHASGEPTETASASAPATSTDTTDGIDAVKALATSPSCTASDDYRVISEFGASSAYAANASSVTSTLTALSSACGADYTSQLTDLLSKDSAVATLGTDHSWWKLTSAAPSGAVEAQDFTTTANNIRCVFGDSDVRCSIYTYSYASPAGCEGKTATYELGYVDKPTSGCTSALNATVTVDYGTTVKHGNFWCSVDQSQGITCTSELSGHGFQIRRNAERLF